MPKTDRRVKYTKAALKQSLLELMRERPINKITVTEVCARADINRNTFYAHYLSPFDLLAQIQNELLEEIQASIQRKLDSQDVTSLLREIFHSIENNGDLCKILFSERGDKEFLRRIVNTARDQSMAEWRRVARGVPDSQLEMFYTFTANGSVGVIEEWVRADMRQSSDELVQFIDQMNRSGLQALCRAAGARPKEATAR